MHAVHPTQRVILGRKLKHFQIENEFKISSATMFAVKQQLI